jgi:hypothetical protein
VLQSQTSGSVQFPCPLHTVGSVLATPEHVVCSHCAPTASVPHLQISVLIHTPLPEQTVESVDKVPKHDGTTGVFTAGAACNSGCEEINDVSMSLFEKSGVSDIETTEFANGIPAETSAEESLVTVALTYVTSGPFVIFTKMPPTAWVRPFPTTTIVLPVFITAKICTGGGGGCVVVGSGVVGPGVADGSGVENGVGAGVVEVGSGVGVGSGVNDTISVTIIGSAVVVGAELGVGAGVGGFVVVVVGGGSVVAEYVPEHEANTTNPLVPSATSGASEFGPVAKPVTEAKFSWFVFRLPVGGSTVVPIPS